MSAHRIGPRPPGQSRARIFGIRSTIRAAEYRFVAAILIPAILFYAAFRFYPLGFALYMSLFDWKLLRSEQFFVGFDNYVTVLSDALFLQVIRNTLYFAFGTTLLGSSLAVTLAIILNPIRRGSSLLRLIYFLPVMTSTIASATIWG